MKHGKIFLVMLLVFSFGCDSISDNNQESTNLNLLKKEWIHSYEEETELVKIFRPSDYKDFPASHYRQSFLFGDENYCKYFVLDAADAHYYEEGTWEFKDNDNLVVIYDSTNHIIHQLEIIELSEDLLKCIYIN